MADNLTKKLHYPLYDTLYLILNIIAHDVIHDYGSAGGSEKRWEDNQAIVKQFTNDYYTFSNPTSGGGGEKRSNSDSSTTSSIDSNEDYQPMKIEPLYPGSNIHGFIPRRTVKAKTFDTLFNKLGQSSVNNPNSINVNTARLNFYSPQEPEDKLTIDYDNYMNELKEMRNDIAIDVIYTFFNHYLYLNNPPQINFMNTEYFIVPYGYNNDLTDLFFDISNKFIGFCFINNVSSNLLYKDYLNVLSDFLSSQAIMQTIFENIDFPNIDMSVIDTSVIKRQKLIGGAKKNPILNPEEAQTLLNEIDALNNDETLKGYLTKLTSIYDEYVKNKGVLTPEQNKDYEDTKKILVSKYQGVFIKYEQTKKAGGLYGNIEIVPLLKVRFSPRSQINLIDNFKKVINSSTLDYIKIVKENELNLEKIERKRLDDLRAGQQGQLTSADKEVRNQFSSFIARSGLFLNGICTNEGIIMEDFNKLTQVHALRKQINILLYIAGWTEVDGWKEVRTKSLDDELINYFENNFINIANEKNERYICSKDSVNAYVVNNAAPIETKLKELSFCPYTSILDGMSQCSWNSAQGSIEYGDVDFKIINDEEEIYYNGKLTIDPSQGNNSYPTKINLSFDVKTKLLELSGNKAITINGHDLEAHFVLKNTLVNVIDYILSVDNTKREQIFNNSNIFANLFTLFSVEDTSSFNKVYSEILFKGTGDLFQEINCVSKFGGYKMTNYKADKGIASYKSKSGDQLRFFAANDRPSGTRFIYMLLKGKPTEINMNAKGGYYSKENVFIVKRPENTKNCSIMTGGITKKNKKTKKSNKTKKVRKSKHNKTKKVRKIKNNKTKNIKRKSKLIK